MGGEADLILAPFETRPAAHDEEVVRGDDGDHVHALGLELVVPLEERREVVRVTRRLRIPLMSGFSHRCESAHGERAGDSEQHDLLALPLVRVHLARCVQL
jgi:hypothetical protein